MRLFYSIYDKIMEICRRDETEGQKAEMTTKKIPNPDIDTTAENSEISNMDMDATGEKTEVPNIDTDIISENSGALAEITVIPDGQSELQQEPTELHIAESEQDSATFIRQDQTASDKLRSQGKSANGTERRGMPRKKH